MHENRLRELTARFRRLPLWDQKECVKILQMLERDGVIKERMSARFLALLKDEADLQ